MKALVVVLKLLLVEQKEEVVGVRVVDVELEVLLRCVVGFDAEVFLHGRG